ncbi:MAG: sigma-70 family RNA polymerase sigma factor [Chloroflexi bacterium]|nr:sigma-70 family RNA polymerase sigma factor [Chloroflexota bacterium]
MSISEQPTHPYAHTLSRSEDVSIIRALRAGDERAFASLVTRYHPTMVRLAMIYVGNHETAKDVVQEVWLGVLRGLDRFEGRSSLKTWIFSILILHAKTRGQRESRTIPFSAWFDADGEEAEPTVDPERFLPADHSEWARHWSTFPRNWGAIPEEQLLSAETVQVIRQAIERLEPGQRAVITLRDIEGWSSAEVCNILQITETNQRVLLHRARAKVRRALEQYFDEQGMSRPTR